VSGCTATGYYEKTSGSHDTLAEQWNGKSWTIQSTPNPTGAGGSFLYGISCSSASACTAIGGSTGTGPGVPLAERYS
jgi:hypothetical protein